MWHALQLKRDFGDYLSKFGKLPVDHLDDKSRIEKELEEYKGIEMDMFKTEDRQREI